MVSAQASRACFNEGWFSADRRASLLATLAQVRQAMGRRISRDPVTTYGPRRPAMPPLAPIGHDELP